MAIPHRTTLDNTPEYVAGKRIDAIKQQYNLDDIVKLSSNENALGPPQSVIRAVTAILPTLSRYPDPKSAELTGAIALHDGIPAENILISHGLEEMIPAICRAYINPGDNTVQPEITFIKYEIAVRIMDGECIKVPMNDYAIDLEELLKAINEKTRMVWLCNPNNPTGTYITGQALSSFLSRVPDDVLVIHDETYREFTTASDYPLDTVKLLATYPNLVIMRSFSKAYGLAGFRCGYMNADSDIVTQVMKVREIFSVDAISATAALAALQDTAYLDHAKEVIRQGRDYLRNRLQQLSSDTVRFIDSQANFFFIETAYPSRELAERMQEEGVIVRPIGANTLRVTIGLHRENIRFLEAFFKALKSMQYKHPGEHDVHARRHHGESA